MSSVFSMSAVSIRFRFSQLLKLAAPFLHRRRRPYSSFMSVFLAVAVSAGFFAGCGSMPPTVTPPPPAAPSSVTIQLSGTANDQFSAFNIDIASFALTNKAGVSINLIPAVQNNGIYQTQNAEFLHLNGASAPLVTAMVPQDVYVSASLTYTYTQFTYVNLTAAGGVHITTDSVGETNAIPITAVVNLPSPIAVSDTPADLLLDLQVMASTTLTMNTSGGPDTYSIKPTFDLTAIPTSPPTLFGQLTGLDGRIASTTASNNSFSLKTVNGYSRPSAPAGSLFNIVTNASTVYQGVNNFSDLAAGMFVNFDLALQGDGSILATRVEVDDPSASNVMIGPLVTVYGTGSALWDFGRLQQGSDLDVNPIDSWGYSVDASTVFKTSQQLPIPSNLPFSATFNSSNMVPGQNVAISSLGISSYVHATTVTLRPQSIDGTVTAVSSAGGSAVYTVALAPYDLFPTLAVQPAQATLLQIPNQVEVYVSGTTRLLNSNSLAPGSAFRFSGLIFNDTGTLRMDCNQVNDGVPE